MLSKSAAKTFFLGGTLACSAAFIGLTVDTFSKIPSQTHENRLSAEVVRGKDLWDSNNCMGCHTLFGEGAYYAPELTRVFVRRGPEFMRAMLRNPEAMFPGERRMQNYHFNERQIDDLVAFLEWAGNVDLNGFPATPNLMPVATPGADGAIARTDDRPHIFNQLCVACHSLGGQGGHVGPALDVVGERFDAAYFERWLRNPRSIRPNTQMPQLPLTESQIHELAGFLSLRRSTPPQPAQTPAQPAEVPAQPTPQGAP